MRIFFLQLLINSIILDSFAGSGTTAHAVLNMNKQDDGNRKFILIEMRDYADSITSERVKRVIDGYGEGKKAVEREFDRKNQSSRHKKPSCILESEQTEGFLGRKE